MSSIQPAGNGGDLLDRFSKARNAGEQVEEFFALAENNSEAAISRFASIIESLTSAPMRALALQGLGRITHPEVKRALASCETEEDLQVLRDIAKEVKGKGEVSSDLTRWAAAWAIEEIFPKEAIEHLEGGALPDPPRRIRNEIINRKLQEIDRIQRCDSRGDETAEYERHLEFWLYGPTEELFRANSNTRNYQDIVGDVIDRLHVRGVQLGTDSQNRRSIQAASLRIAEQIFLKSTETDQRRLYEYLEPFLSNEYNQDIPLRRLAAVAIDKAGSWLSPSTRSRVFVICERWQQIEVMGESAVSHLEEVIERQLLLATSESDISDQQINAVKTIYKLQLADFDQNLKLLARVLLHPEGRVRNAAARLLEQHKSILDRDVANLLNALVFEYGLNQPDSRELTFEKMEDIIRLARQDQSQIVDIFSLAIAATDSLSQRYKYSSLEVRQFLQYSCDRHLSSVEMWIESKLNSIVYQIPKLDLKDMTIGEIDQVVRSLEQDQSRLKVAFSAAITTADSSLGSYDCTNSGWKPLLQGKRDVYLSEIADSLKILREQKVQTSAEQAKIQSNQFLLNTAFSESRSLDYNLFYDKINSLPNQAAITSNEYQTYNQCQKLLPNLASLRSSLLYKLNERESELDEQSKTVFSLALYSLFGGFVTILVILVTALIIAPYVEQNKPQSYNGNNDITSTTPWYATGFPKANGCGSSSSANNCWYPVFVQYSDSNWNKIIANHCSDIQAAQSQKTAINKGKIQVASFNNQEDAQGFANYMQNQYGTGWVEPRRCY